MTALADGLAAAQGRAVAVLGKQYVAGAISVDAVVASLDSIGLTDKLDAARWLGCLDIIREAGGDAPQEQEPRKPDPASDRQLAFIQGLADDRETVAPNKPLTKDDAHTVIEQLQAGTYDPDEWTVPF